MIEKRMSDTGASEKQGAKSPEHGKEQVKRPRAERGGKWPSRMQHAKEKGAHIARKAGKDIANSAKEVDLVRRMLFQEIKSPRETLITDVHKKVQQEEIREGRSLSTPERIKAELQAVAGVGGKEQTVVIPFVDKKEPQDAQDAQKEKKKLVQRVKDGWSLYKNKGETNKIVEEEKKRIGRDLTGPELRAIDFIVSGTSRVELQTGESDLSPDNPLAARVVGQRFVEAVDEGKDGKKIEKRFKEVMKTVEPDMTPEEQEQVDKVAGGVRDVIGQIEKPQGDEDIKKLAENASFCVFPEKTREMFMSSVLPGKGWTKEEIGKLRSMMQGGSILPAPKEGNGEDGEPVVAPIQEVAKQAEEEADVITAPVQNGNESDRQDAEKKLREWFKKKMEAITLKGTAKTAGLMLLLIFMAHLWALKTTSKAVAGGGR